MSECELCGSKNATRKTKIDNAILNVCEDCVRFGEEIATVELRPVKKMVTKLEGLGLAVKSNFHVLVKDERAKRKLTQEELAKKLNEKPSIIKRIEDGWEPPNNTIKKLERFFNVKLTEEIEESKTEKKSGKADLTIGDVVEFD
jgi:putative transcription factor